MTTGFPNSLAIFFKSFQFPPALKSTSPRDNSTVGFLDFHRKYCQVFKLADWLSVASSAEAPSLSISVTPHSEPAHMCPQNSSGHISFRLAFTLQENEAENKGMPTAHLAYTAQSLMLKDYSKRFKFKLLRYF